MSENTNSPKSESAISVRAMDIITALLFIILGLVVMTGSVKLGASWGSDGPEAGYFPFYISLIFILSSSITLYQAAVVDKKKKLSPSLIKNLLSKFWQCCFRRLFSFWVYNSSAFMSPHLFILPSSWFGWGNTLFGRLPQFH